MRLGLSLGTWLGLSLGLSLGTWLGLSLGAMDGGLEGLAVGNGDGCGDGGLVGALVGLVLTVGSTDGCGVVGDGDGGSVGFLVGGSVFLFFLRFLEDSMLLMFISSDRRRNVVCNFMFLFVLNVLCSFVIQ